MSISLDQTTSRCAPMRATTTRAWTGGPATKSATGSPGDTDSGHAYASGSAGDVGSMGRGP